MMCVVCKKYYLVAFSGGDENGNGAVQLKADTLAHACSPARLG